MYCTSPLPVTNLSQKFKEMKKNCSWIGFFHFMHSLYIICTRFVAETLKLSNVLHMLSGVDEVLAQHVAHLFIRDPVSLFEEKIQQSIEDDVDHFEVGY